MIVDDYMISVIIPTYNESACIKTTIQTLWKSDMANLVQQILVCDGGSTDGTAEAALGEGVEVIRCGKKGRSAQMNAGARKANGSVLYFLHADTIPPKNFSRDIVNAIARGFGAGCYRLSFNHPHWFLTANSWFTRFDVNAVRFGDQSLFVQRELFLKSGGFCEKHIVLEDQDMVKRLKKIVPFIVMKKAVITSARKYLENGIYKTQGIFFIIFALYQLGFSQQKLVGLYRNLIRQDKL